jgi:hypothetical protein
MARQSNGIEDVVTPGTFVSEVEAFRKELADPAVPVPLKARAYALIVKHAAQLNPRDTGFERAGVALKCALCDWLDTKPGSSD